MRKVYIDCGCAPHVKGGKDTVLEFLSGKMVTSDKSERVLMSGFTPSEFEIYAFDLNVCEYDNPKVHFERKACWIKDDIIMSKIHNSDGDSIVCDNSNSSIQCFDFSKWLTDNFTKDDEIYLKMDIEGAEFEILKKMINDGSIRLITWLAVEFHDFIYKEFTPLKIQLLEELKKNVKTVMEWY